MKIQKENLFGYANVGVLLVCVIATIILNIGWQHEKKTEMATYILTVAWEKFKFQFTPQIGYLSSITVDGRFLTIKKELNEELKKLYGVNIMSRAEEKAYVSNIVSILDVEYFKNRFRPIYPTGSQNFTSYFGLRQFVGANAGGVYGKNHKGLDIGGYRGEPVLAIADGSVIRTGYDRAGFGNYVVVDHGDGWRSIYGHLLKVTAQKGDDVFRGDIVGKLGTSGRSSGYHVHLQIEKNGGTINPLFVLP